jgi:hypothetical protein
MRQCPTYIFLVALSIHKSFAFLSTNKNFPPIRSPDLFSLVRGPSVETKPDYECIHGPLGPLMDTLFMRLFRAQLAKHVGVDSDKPQNDYMGLMELTTAMNARYSDRSQVQRIAQNVLSK